MTSFRRLIPARADELRRVSLLFTVYFLFSLGVTWSTGSLTAIILTEFGMSFYANALILFGITTMAVSSLYTVLVDRIPPHRLLVRMTALFSAAGAIATALLLVGARPIAIMTLVVLSETMTLVWVIHWKTAVTSVFDTRASKRILPFLGAGQLLGIVIGGLSYIFITRILNFLPDQVLMLWVGTLVLCALILWLMPRLLNDTVPAKIVVSEGYLASIRDGFVYIRGSSYLRWLAASIVLMTALVVLVQFKVAEQVLRQYASDFPGDSRAQAQAIGGFLAWIEALAALAMLPVQVFLFPRLLERLGMGSTNLIYPLVTLVVTTIFIGAIVGNVAPALALLITAVAHIDRTAFRRVFRSSINALLYNAVPPYMKGRARSVINGIFAPVAVIAVGLIGHLANESVVMMILFLLAGSYAAAAFILRRKYTDAMLELVEKVDYASLLSDHFDTGKADSDTLRMMAKQLNESRSREFQEFMVTIMANVGGNDALPVLIDFAATADEDMKLVVMQTLVDAGLDDFAARTFFVSYVNDEDRFMRRAALTGLLRANEADASAGMTLAMDFLHDPDHVVRAQMITALLRSGDARQKDRARRVLNVMLTLDNAETRAEAVTVLVNLGDPQHIPELVKFLSDGDDEVRLVAVRGIQTLWRDDLPPEIRDAVLAQEDQFLYDRVERVRQEEMALLRLIGGEAACEALVRGLTDKSLMVRQNAMQSLVEIGGIAETYLQQAKLSSDTLLVRQATITLGMLNPERYRPDVLRIIQATLDTLYANLTSVTLLDSCRAYASFEILVGYYQEQNRLLQQEVFDLLGIIYGAGAIHSIYDGLLTGGSERDNAAETLESLAGGEVAQQIIPLFEAAPDRKAPHLQGKRTTQDVIRELVTGQDAFLRAVTVTALGEVSEHYPQVKRVLLDKPADDAPLTACQRALDPGVIAVLIRTALASHDADIRIAAKGAVRLILGENVLDSKKTTEEKAVLATIERMIYLKRLSFFQSLSVEQLAAVANACEEHLFRKDDVLFRQKERGGVVYIVISGAVDVGLHGDDGQGFMRLATYNASSVFGEMSLFDNAPRSADAIATQDTLTLTLRRETFLALMRQYPDMSIQLVAMLSSRLRQANLQMSELRSTVSRNMEI